MAITLQEMQSNFNKLKSQKKSPPVKKKFKRRAQYYFLPRKQQDAISQVKKEHVLQLLVDGDWQNFVRFYGLIADYYECSNGVVMDEWLEILKLPMALCKTIEKLQDQKAH